MKDDRLIRNWAQVKYSDAIFAIGTIVNPGEKIFPNQKSDTRVAIKQAVTGGTGYAVEMGIQAGKPVYVFNQADNAWYTWDDASNSFIKTEIPTLTNNFAGIGSRQLTDAGKAAIREVYEKSIGTEVQQQLITDTEVAVEETSVSNEPAKVGNTIVFSDATGEFGWLSPFSAPELDVYAKASEIFVTEYTHLDLLAYVKSVFDKNPALMKKLLDTKDRAIIFDTTELADEFKDSYYGIVDGVGENILGKVYMVIRETYANDFSHQPVNPGDTNVLILDDVEVNLTSIGIPFKLNDQQVKALQAMVDWSKTNQSTFTLEGYAGTGKTTIMKVFVEYMNVKRKSYSLAAPTHKSAGVLRKSTRTVTMSDVLTIDKLLGIKPVYSTSGVRSFEPGKKNEVKQGSIIVIDEFSLISDKRVDIIKAVAEANDCKVLFLGDSNQLYPVEQQSVSKAATSDVTLKLDKVERQTGANPLIAWLGYIRENIDKFGRQIYRISNLTKNNDGRLYVGELDRQEWIDTAITLFKSEEYDRNPDYVKMLAYTNNRVALLNFLVRRAMGYTNSSVINEGETLTAYNTYTDEETGVEIYNASDYKVVSSKQTPMSSKELKIYDANGKAFDLNPTNLVLRDVQTAKEYAIKVLTTSEDKAAIAPVIISRRDAVKSEINSMYKEVDAGNISSKDAAIYTARAWKAYNEWLDNIHTTFDVVDSNNVTVKEKLLDFGYAITIHKSQGSTYTYAFVDESDISVAERNSAQNAMQLRYVAMSRPSKAAIVITGNTISQSTHFDSSNMNLQYFNDNNEANKNESDDTAFKTCK